MTSHAPVVLRPPLSDARTYVHGADLFDELVASTGARADAQLRLTRISDNPIELRHDTPEPQSESFCGLFHYSAGGSSQRSWLRLIPEEVVRERSSLMDLDILSDAQLGADSATVTRRSDCSIAKTALVLAVFLLEQLFPDDFWNLAEIAVQTQPADCERVGVRISRQINRFLLVSVSADGVPWGQVTLAANPPQVPVN